MSSVVKLLEAYRVDRAAGMTLDGSTQLVVLMLKPLAAPELAVAISKADAVLIAHQLMAAASEAQKVMNR